MKILLEHIETLKENFSVNDGLNFGRFYNHKKIPFEIYLSKKEIIELIEKEYIEIRDEIKNDDRLYNDSSDFTNTNYCSLNELFNHESDMEIILKTYLDKILYAKIFNDNYRIKYIINSTSSLKIRDHSIVLSGNVYEIKNK